MNEYGLQLIAVIKVVWAAGFAYLYGLGGIRHKYIRRFLAPLWLVIGISVFTHILGYFTPLFIIYYPLLAAALHLGYGADEPVEKIKKRMIYGTTLGFSAIPLAIITKGWVLFGLHITICVIVSVVLGVINPMRSARDEETAIGFVACFLPLYM